MSTHAEDARDLNKEVMRARIDALREAADDFEFGPEHSSSETTHGRFFNALYVRKLRARANELESVVEYDEKRGSKR